MTTTPDFRAELQILLDLYEALGGNWTPHGYTDTWNDALAGARTALATPLGPPKNCWLDDEPDLCPSPCVFDDPSEVIRNCTYAQTVKCKTNCEYYRAATPPPEPLRPIPLSERLPGPEDCLFNPGATIGSCWIFNPIEVAGGIAWWSFEPLEWNESGTHWLPANAIPLAEETP